MRLDCFLVIGNSLMSNLVRHGWFHRHCSSSRRFTGHCLGITLACFVALLSRLTQSYCLLLFYRNIMSGNESDDGEQRQRAQPAREDPYNERNDFDIADLAPISSPGMAVNARAVLSMFAENEDSVVSLEDLTTDGNKIRSRSVGIFQILRITKSSKQAQGNMTRRKMGGNVTPVNYDRVLYAMDIFGRAGHNVAVILLGSGSNDQFWKYDIAMRDGLQTNSKAYIILLFVCILATSR